MPSVEKKRIGILVVAYNAATTLAKVLDRIPDEIRGDIQEVIVSDDHSQDSTYLVGLGYKQVSDLPITLIRQPTNLGYGGNQKAGYDLAIEHGLDIVVMLHGDGQYAPESLPDIVAPLLAGEADAVFGSRILIKGAARQGGMPLYKYVGNRILSRFENAALGTDLSEFHSGYRAYSTSALKQIPFERNSDGFNFDTQIIIQLHDAGMRIAEVPIPTYYGDEICYVDGMGYAADVTKDVVGLSDAKGRVRRRQPHRPQRGVSAQAQRGQLARSDLDAAQVGTAEQDPRPRMFEWAAVGTAPGDGAPRHRCRPQRARRRRRADRRVLPGQSERRDPARGGYRLRHRARGRRARAPGQSRGVDAAGARRALAGGTAIFCVPNVAHWYPRFRSTFGMFDYDQRGILDSTHLRFFTRRSIRRLIERQGYDIRRIESVGLPLDVLGVDEGRTNWLRLADHVSLAVWPTMFSYQFIVAATPTPA